MKKFNNYDEFENWVDTFENPGEIEEIPVAIDDGWKISVDMATACKSYKTALRRFEKIFREVSEDITPWVEVMRESCENGYFKDMWKPGWTATEDEIKEYSKNGTYSWGVEEISDDSWYIFLNISGIYAGRKAD